MTNICLDKTMGSLGRLRRAKWAGLLLWTLLIIASLSWNIHQQHRQSLDLAINEARANFNKDLAFRLWATKHGGVYVPTDERTPPNEHLQRIPERDIETPSGRKLTLMNPAYMLRQLMTDYSELYGVRGRITSLNYLNPINAPDEWEKKALLAFGKGVPEILEFGDIDGKPYLRLMRPMITREGCLKCHEHQGYKVDDIRGGVGVSVAMAPYLAAERRSVNAQSLTHGVIWLLGIGAIQLVVGQTRRRIEERMEAEKAIRQSEQRLRTILNNSTAVIFLKDREGKYLLVNRQYELLFHVAADEIIGKTDRDIFPALTADAFLANDREVLAANHPLEFEEIFPQDDGIHYYISIKFPLHDDSGRPQAVCCIATDITRRKKTEDALAARTAELEISNAELQQFAYVASHDLNEPLNSISGYVNLLAAQHQGRLGTDADEYIGYTLDGVQRMKELIKDLILYHHSGKQIETFETTDLNLVVDNALSSLEGMASEVHASMTHASMPTLEVDPSRMIRVFQLLVSNAIKFHDQHRPLTVHIDVEDGGHEWIFSVRDNGVGIEPRYFNRIFVIFQRLHPHHEYPGTGIGLAICKRIIERHGGRMWVESASGQGSTFLFTLPKEHMNAPA